MATKIITLNEGDPVPEGAKFLSADKVPDPENAYQQWAPTKGFWGAVPIFGTETLTRYTPYKTVFYYEVETLDSARHPGLK